ncbi:hypothetical protein AB0O64_04260 [Streptomyces sp. NPDC088341]|uniref:hypothetical protein n=1 Tax=Streptomyces sp. NPDC088341 TaxID=3154870 RepID=UPI00342CE135
MTSEVQGLVSALAESGSRGAARLAAWDLLEKACVAGGASVQATAPEAVGLLLRLLARGDTEWTADVLGVLDATAYMLGEWENQQQRSGAPWLYESEVGWETAVEGLLALGLGPVRELLAHHDPEARSMAAVLLGDASTDWTADLDLLLAAEAVEPHPLARACLAEAAVTIAGRSPSGELPVATERWLRDPEPSVRFRVARAVKGAPSDRDARLAESASRVLDTDHEATRQVWPAEV